MHLFFFHISFIASKAKVGFSDPNPNWQVTQEKIINWILFAHIIIDTSQSHALRR
jgi:hypothetical protein